MKRVSSAPIDVADFDRRMPFNINVVAHWPAGTRGTTYNRLRLSARRVA